ncbi:DUF1178 family protein [Thalassovita sp.]|uniref:DUF1178 family protein n=1 Tax=Thalassovita sp. TaxID=1979401 RepID=UPI0028815ACA|nr:DUF1178 family protein [Thalassovita sp.]MDF1804089.1 DUF1178 family protein [Thalassovita sp.]
MIQYVLKCANDHRFDSWFQSGEAFDKLKAAGMVSCSVCGSTDVEKAIMAPRVRPARSAQPQETDTVKPPQRPDLSQPASETERAITALRKKVEETSEYVGNNFAKEARAMHDGDAPERAIYGEAKPGEAKKLLEEGVPVLPLPFSTGRKTN